MKRFCGILVAVAVLAMVFAGSGRAGIGFRITGGYSYATYPDYNDYVDYVNDEQLTPMGVTEKIDNINWMPEFGGEFLMSLIPSLDVGVGAGIIMGKSEFSYFVGTDGLIFEHKVNAYPIAATCYFKPSVPFAAFKPFLNIGWGVYYSKITFEQKLTDGVTEWGYDSEMTDWGFGLHGGAGIEIPIGSVVSAEIGFKGRWAKLKGYEGTATWTDGNKIDVFYGKEEDEDGSIEVGPKSVEDRDEYDEAAVSLSGYGFTIGVKVMF